MSHSAEPTRVRDVHPRRVYRPLLVLVVAGVLLRLLTMVTYSTVVGDYYTGDAGRYIRVGYDGLFEDEWQPAGYAAFLAGVRAVVDELTVTVALQHLLGIVTGLLLYATVRRAGGSRPVALAPAAFVLLSGDHLFLEHAFLAETTWMACLAAGLYLTVRGGAVRDVRWIAAASAVLALSAVVRNVSLLLPGLLAVFAVITLGGPLRARLRTAAAAIVPAVIVVLLYAVTASSIGSYTGLGEMSGWSLYTRAGQFADCRAFTPPAGTRGLCEQRPTGQRPGPFYYYFGLDAPARRAFPGLLPKDSAKAGAFARAAILNQPIDYTRTVAKDVLRYFDPRAGFDRELSGSTLDDMSFRSESPDPANTARFTTQVRTRYDGVDPTPDAGTSLLETYQRVFRLNGLLLLVLLAATVVGVVRGTVYARLVCAFCAASAGLLLLLPPMVSSYDGRYAVPPAMLLSVSACLGVAALRRRETLTDGAVRSAQPA